MVDITKCIIDPTTNELKVEGHVKTDSYYTNVYISKVSVIIDDYPADPIAEQFYSQNTETKEFTLEFSTVRLNLESLNNHIFFVQVETTGEPTPDIPCGLDKRTTVAVAVDPRIFYSKAINFIKEMDNTCSVPKGFMDYILRTKAFDLAVQTGNYKLMAKFFNKLFKDNEVTVTNNCGCNGK